MHMIFVDESGDPGYPQDGNWDSWGGSTHFARVGVIIHGWKWKAWNRKLLEFKRSNGIPWNAEIKASFIRQGKGPFLGWDSLRRERFMLDFLELVGLNTDITLIGIIIDKKKIDITKGDRFKRPEVRSLELLLERYNSFLGSQTDKSGIVVLDPTKENRDDNLRYFQSFLQAQSPNLQPLHIVESTFFAKSHTSNMIQVADVCTNVFYRYMAGKKNEAEYKRIFPRFMRGDSGRVIGYGIKRWP